MSEFYWNWRNYGSFTGPGNSEGDFDYDYYAAEGIWHKTIPQDVSFNINDMAYLLFKNKTVYTGHYADGTDITKLTLGSSFGLLPEYYHLVSNSFSIGEWWHTGTFHGSFDGNLSGNASTATNASYADKAGHANSAGSVPQQGWKGFDISHPKKEKTRIRHICVEGPEAAIYIRGRCENTSIINLPEYWNGLVDTDNISVHLTPFGSPQNLFVQEIRWGNQVIIKNADGGPVNCFYHVWAPRLGELHVEYEGESASDYPGDQSEHSICGYHYDRRNK